MTATKTENNLATAPASMSVISSEEIQSRPHTALNDIVAEAVGVESMKTGGRAGRELITDVTHLKRRNQGYRAMTSFGNLDDS